MSDDRAAPLALTELDDEGVFTITMNRPERRNAMSPAAFRAVGEAFLEANANPAVATVLLTGAGDRALVDRAVTALIELEGEGPAALARAMCAAVGAVAAETRRQIEAVAGA